jgi:uncharacterized surface protein with fasciclin (FAS1) repeats
MNRIALPLLALPLAISLAVVVPARSPIAAATPAPSDIVSTAKAAGSFGTLLAAVEAAGLADTLRSPGPFTVFAPTDAAFAKLPKGTVEGLLAPAAREKLKTILAYHVVAGRVLSKDLLPTHEAPTLAGVPVVFGLKVGSASVVQADVPCSNGVIHVIDEVLLPPAPSTPAVPAMASASSPTPTAVIRAALDRGVPLYNGGNVAGCVAAYEEGASALLRLPDDALGPIARADLRRTLDQRAADASTRAWDLRHAFDRILEDEAFEPLVEAPMPAGFPKPGPVGRAVVKQYPAYRAARARGASSFFTLFGHIQKNSVEMTAPVEMTMGDGAAVTDMAFLYESQSLGRAGADGNVTVMDLPASTVISFGLRGEPNDETVALARAAIEARMRAEGYTAAGPWRRMGYNSPMVASSRRFSEIQLPVRR